jgi:hypothetical protein
VNNQPPVTAPRVRPGPDYADAFGFLFKRPGGVQAILIGGILLMFSFLIVPLLVVLGYGVALGRATAAGDPELPRFQIGMAADGLKAVVVMLLYSVPIIVVYVLALIPMFLMSSDGSEGSPLFIFSTFGIGLVAIAYALVFVAMQPAVFAVFIADGTIGSCFRFERIKDLVKTWGGDYAAAAAIVFGMSYAGQLGFILLFIGVFFTMFYHLAFTSHVSGQLARPLITGVAPGSDPAFAENVSPAPVYTEPLAPPGSTVPPEEPETPGGPSGRAT